METELRILLLEDVAEEAKLIERVIRKEKLQFECVRVDSRDQFSEAMKDFRPHLVLSDHALPQFNSIEALKLARNLDKDVPFILVTGTVSEEFAVACLKQGANDYVLKSNLSRLPSAIKQALLQKEAQEKKKEAEDELREQNIKLSISNEELLKRNKELDSFVYSVSHNLRGPLSSILGMVNLSRMDVVHDPSVLFDKIEASIKRLDGTLKEILDYSRNTRTDTEFEKVDLVSVFQENCARLSYLPNCHAHEFDISGTFRQPIYTDLYRINLIIQNILSNSIKYCDEKKTHKHINFRVESSAGEVTMTFEDNGVGIPEEVMPRIFNMFFRGNTKSEGAGLGLYIVREAVGKIGGTIDVKSKENIGTTVTVKIPAHVEQPA